MTQSLAVVLPHALQQVDGTNQVILVVLQSLSLRFSHVLEGSEVDHGVKGSVLFKHSIGSHGVKQRALDGK